MSQQDMKAETVRRHLEIIADYASPNQGFTDAKDRAEALREIAREAQAALRALDAASQEAPEVADEVEYKHILLVQQVNAFIDAEFESEGSADSTNKFLRMVDTARWLLANDLAATPTASQPSERKGDA